jgi:Domain of unknown function (DUF5658)
MRGKLVDRDSPARRVLVPVNRLTHWKWGALESTLVLMMVRVKQNQSVLVKCAGLQIMDLLSTLLFLAHGVKEANPLVKWSISVTDSNVAGLVAVKCIACLLALAAVQSGRTALVVKINRFFVFLVLWNLTALALSFGVR